MGQWFLVATVYVEALSNLVVFLVADFIVLDEIVAGGEVENGAADVSFALPHLVDNPVHVIDLQETVQFELCNVLDH